MNEPLFGLTMFSPPPTAAISTGVLGKRYVRSSAQTSVDWFVATIHCEGGELSFCLSNITLLSTELMLTLVSPLTIFKSFLSSRLLSRRWLTIVPTWRWTDGCRNVFGEQLGLIQPLFTPSTRCLSLRLVLEWRGD